MQLVNSEILEGLTFDDVLLVPARSEVLPRSVDVSTKFTREISLHTPIVSSAMDTVTEADLAIAMARSGGIGVIHKNMTIEQQCEQVRRVKRAENGMIYDPVTIGPEATVGDALALMAKQHIGGIPVVDNAGKLIGIITNRDLRFQDNRKLSISEVMTKENLITAKKGISLEEATCILRSSKVEKLPVVDDDNTLVGLITYKDLMKIKDNPIASKDSKGRLLVAAAVGVKSDTLDRIEMLVSAGADAVVIDTAHGHSVGVLGVIAKACEAFKNRDIQIVAGNVATGEGAKALADAGVSAVKVGIGPGSICTTRIIAGVGMPQLTAVMLASKALEGTGVPVIADGGIRYSGDIVKALAAGASTIWQVHFSPELRSLRVRLSSLTEESSRLIVEWVLSRLWSMVRKTDISRIWKRISRSSFRKESWHRFHSRVLFPKLFISLSAVSVQVWDMWELLIFRNFVRLSLYVLRMPDSWRVTLMT